MRLNNNQQAFLALLKAGLWEKEFKLSEGVEIDFIEVYRIAEIHASTGLIAAGFEHVTDMKIPQEIVFQFVGAALQLEQRNNAMNEFINTIIDEMRRKGIYTILVKGQGLAQCYIRPLWRACGDIDFFFSDNEFVKAVKYFKEIGAVEFQNAQYTKSYGVILKPWMIELHGTLRSVLSTTVDKEIDNVQKDIFWCGDVRTWKNGKIDIFLPGVNSDIFLLFTHFIRHFYKNVFVIRQVCDWCRLLWSYREMIDTDLLTRRLNRTHLLPEWKAFASVAVEWLGMPSEVMPLYDDSSVWMRKADKIISFALCKKKPSKIRDVVTVAWIFPANTFRFLPSLLFNVNCLKIKERFAKHIWLRSL